MSRTPRNGLWAIVAFLALSCGAAEASATIIQPPRPAVSFGRVGLSAEPGAFCYAQSAGMGVCTAGLLTPPTTVRALPVICRGRGLIRTYIAARRIHLRTPASDRPFAYAYAFPSRKLWAFYVPRTLRGTVTMLLDIEYPRGKALFGVKLASRCPH